MTKTATPLAEAQDLAGLLRLRLTEVCDRVEVAGSIRRRKTEVGDIELVVVPRVRVEPDGMWGDTIEVDLLGEFVERLVGIGALEYDDSDRKAGTRYQKLRYPNGGLQVDLFAVKPPAQFGLILLIRTGPADYSRWFVTEARRRGFHAAHGGLHTGGIGHAEPSLCRCPVIETPEEEDVYRVLGLPFEQPWQRWAA